MLNGSLTAVLVNEYNKTTVKNVNKKELRGTGEVSVSRPSERYRHWLKTMLGKAR